MVRAGVTTAWRKGRRQHRAEAPHVVVVVGAMAVVAVVVVVMVVVGVVVVVVGACTRVLSAAVWGVGTGRAVMGTLRAARAQAGQRWVRRPVRGGVDFPPSARRTRLPWCARR